MDKYANIFYNSALTTLGVIGLGFVSRKVMKDSFGTPVTLQGSLKLGILISLSNAIVTLLPLIQIRLNMVKLSTLKFQN